jgi:hypothetical protein
VIRHTSAKVWSLITANLYFSRQFAFFFSLLVIHQSIMACKDNNPASSINSNEAKRAILLF